MPRYRVFSTVTLMLTEEIEDAKSGEHAANIHRSRMFSDNRCGGAIADITITKVEGPYNAEA